MNKPQTKTIGMSLFGILAAFPMLLMLSTPTEAVPYYGHDGSVDQNLTKVVVEKMRNKGNIWSYIVKACADDHTLAVAAVILKSDMEERVLGVNKNIVKGDCTYYGAVMKAKNGDTLGAELIEKHEALSKYNNILNGLKQMDGDQKSNALDELHSYRNMLGGLL